MCQSIYPSTWQVVDTQKVRADTIIMIILRNALSSTKRTGHTPWVPFQMFCLSTLALLSSEAHPPCHPQIHLAVPVFLLCSYFIEKAFSFPSPSSQLA